MKVTFKQQAPPRDDHDYNRMKHEQQEEINRILEKISKSGYEKLTKEEKEILFRQGTSPYFSIFSENFAYMTGNFHASL